MALVSLGWPREARAGEVQLDGGELVKDYRDFIERYRRNDPALSQAGRALVLQAAGWNLDMARMAATLAAMRPPTKDTVVRLEDEDPAATRSAGGHGGRSSAMGAHSDTLRNDDALERALTETRRRLAEEAGGAAPQREPRVTATLAAAPGETTPSIGGCLISRFAQECADALKAAAVLHTDVATMELARGAHERAASHRAIAGWLLWHLPQLTQDDAFVRDWVLAVDGLLLSDGSLSSARQLGQLGLARFPNDGALLFSTARATEALATLCYGPDGTAVGGDDCGEAPVSFDGLRPVRPKLRDSQAPRQGAVLRETERLLRAVVKERPTDPEVHLRLGRALARLGQAEEAETELLGVVTDSRDANEVALAHLLLGRLAESRKDVQGALEHARAALAKAPHSQSARMALASAQLAVGERRGAVEAMASLPTTPPEADDLWAEFLQGSMAHFAPARASLYDRVKLP